MRARSVEFGKRGFDVLFVWERNMSRAEKINDRSPISVRSCLPPITMVCTTADNSNGDETFDLENDR